MAYEFNLSFKAPASAPYVIGTLSICGQLISLAHSGTDTSSLNKLEHWLSMLADMNPREPQVEKTTTTSPPQPDTKVMNNVVDTVCKVLGKDDNPTYVEGLKNTVNALHVLHGLLSKKEEKPEKEPE
jgi:hypothetical protein